MVARPPVRIVVELMKIDDLPEVQVIERESFTTPWPAHAYRQELETNRLAHYIVARCGDLIVGFAGIWLLVDEAHVTTFATRKSWRRQGIGERLLLALLDLARTRGAHEATLEVRPSNLPARRLYEKYGFKVVGVRPRYYSDDNEDALIMTTESLDGRNMRDRIARLRADIGARPDIELGPDGLPIVPAAGTQGLATAGGSGPVAGSPASGAEHSGGSVAGGAGGSGRDAAADSEPRDPRVIRPSSVARRTR
jgi:[ribosomal protein S18]-alanine N-acetyltransferase